MLRQRSFRPYLDPQPEPRQNRLLAALPDADYVRLLPHLEPVALPLGWAVHGAGGSEKHLYFVTAGIVSRFYVLEDGSQAGFSITGNEGVVGIACFLADGNTTSQAVVLSAGSAYRLGADALKREFNHLGALPLLLLRYTHALITQTTQTAVCNRHHSVEQQLCRRILSCLDRLPSSELVITQELLGEMLGVRREAVTEAVGKLQKAGALHHSRGRITVLSRSCLEAHACECYAVVKREYQRLLPQSKGEEHLHAGSDIVAIDNGAEEPHTAVRALRRPQHRRAAVRAARLPDGAHAGGSDPGRSDRRGAGGGARG